MVLRYISINLECGKLDYIPRLLYAYTNRFPGKKQAAGVDISKLTLTSFDGKNG